ncbi:hypothetical protein QR680_014751 [Steinernema hermaphroditum]|uniref:G-protein coupled receptors family 1 profile domain-containing protein n=1 Tax=Steinernema hermaphroditum TaxID=289476 RepID=A0AA39ICK7_9BILA|nr:hypothetical protein QR680_014751 [Steinernema hermaphroditum]
MALTNWNMSQGELLLFSHYLAPYFIVIFALSIVFNGILIVVTIRSPRLRSNCNILIALQALCDIGITFSVPVYAYNTYRNRLVSVSACFLTQLLPNAAGNCTTLLMLLTALDRYLSVAYPLWYNSLNQTRYLAFYFVVCALDAAVFTVVPLLLPTDHHQVLCFLTDAMTERMKNGWVACQAIIVVSVLIVYWKLHRFLKYRPVGSDRETRSVIKALHALVLVYSLGWGASICIMCVSRILISDPNIVQAEGIVQAVFCAFNITVPCVIYYCQSSLYRKEIRLFFGIKSDVATSNARNNIM